MSKRDAASRYAKGFLGTVQRGQITTSRTRLKAMLRDAFEAGWEAGKQAKPQPKQVLHSSSHASEEGVFD